MYLLCVVLVVISFYQCSAFNMAVKHAIVITAKHDHRYFGYTLAFEKYNSSSVRLIVGAPGDNDKKPGSVYRCEVVTVNESCSKIPTGNKSNTAWIGGTIAVQNEGLGYIVVCDSRFKQRTSEMTGICYYWKGEEGSQSLELVEKRILKNTRKDAYNYGFFQSGFSAHFVPGTNQLLVGAVGRDSWRGELLVYKHRTNQYSKKDFSKEEIPIRPRDLCSQKDCYAGYAIASGRIFSENNMVGPVSYIVGVPRSTYTGQVFIITIDHNNTWGSQMLTGQQMGEYFGSSLLVTDINGDNWDDLIVGAPMYTNRPSSTAHTGYDEGRIYVYVNKKGILEESKSEKHIMGSVFQGARFATSLADVGDINRDGYKDIAVGAPYEDGKGAVYIYHGSSEGLKTKFSQRILAKDISSTLSGFGISITSGLDIDNNSFNDIAVGSYESGHVVIIRSHPIVEFHATIQTTVDKLSNDTKIFGVNACLRYTTKADRLRSLGVNMHFQVDPILGRATFLLGSTNSSNHSGLFQLHRDKDEWWWLNATLKENNVIVVQPLTIILSFNMVNDPRRNTSKEFCSDCPITDPRKPSSITKEIAFVNGCHNANGCESDLRILTYFKYLNIMEPFIIGSSQNIMLHVEVSNSGDPAYMSQLYLIVPKETRLNRIPSTCHQQHDTSVSNDANQEILVCRIGDPLYAEQKNVINFDIDMTMVDINTEILMFNVTANSISKELNNTDNINTPSLSLQLEADVTITGSANKEQVFITNIPENKQLDIVHIYEVTNFGPSPVEQVDVKFIIPVAIRSSSSKDINFTQLLEASVTLKDKLFPCVINWTLLPNADYLITDDNMTGETNEDEEGNTNMDSGIIISRRRRNIFNVKEWQMDKATTMLNRTMFVNCTDANSSSRCQQVMCHIGPLDRPEDIANITIKMTVKPKVLEQLMKGNERELLMKDMLKLTTVGVVSISNAKKYRPPKNNRPNFALVHTNFLGQVIGEEVASWILPLSVAVGIVLLMILTTSLMKAGFFRRSEKEKLEALKNSAVKEEFGNTDNNVDCPNHNDTEETEGK